MNEKTKQETALVSIDKESLHEVIKEYLKNNLEICFHEEDSLSEGKYTTVRIYLKNELIVESDKYNITRAPLL